MKILGVEFDDIGSSNRLIVGDIIINIYPDQYPAGKIYRYFCDINLPTGFCLEDTAKSREDVLMRCLQQYLNNGGRNEAVLEKLKYLEDNYIIKDILEWLSIELLVKMST